MSRSASSILCGIALCLLLASRALGAEPSAQELVVKIDELLRGKTSHGRASLEVVNPDWRRTIRMEFWSQGTERFFIHIAAPPREKGTRFLKMGNLLYQWVPAAEMRIKITPSMMLQSWMGSDFTNDDLVKESSIVEDYTSRLLGYETVGGARCYRLEMIPKPAAPIVWGRVVLWARVSDLVPLREEYFDEEGKKVRTLVLSDIRRAGDRNYPMRWEMTPHDKPGHVTRYVIEEVVFNGKIDPAVFTLKNLESRR